MKTLNLKYLIAVILIFTGNTVYSQSDSERVYFPNDLLINYSGDSLESVSLETGKKTIIPVIQDLDNINTLRILNDSLISVSNGSRSNALLNINKINEISVKNGSNLGLGIGIGTLAGLGVALLIISSENKKINNPNDPYQNLLNPVSDVLQTSSKALGGILSVIAGALIGGIIGGNTPSYKTYEMDKYKFDKKQELERILRVDSKLNGH